jgi:hypothetical protein
VFSLLLLLHGFRRFEMEDRFLDVFSMFVDEYKIQYVYFQFFYMMDLIGERSFGCLLVHFAVNWESMGQPKAKSVCALLQELNESVGAKFVEESPEALLESNPAFFAQFTLVIATQVLLICNSPSHAVTGRDGIILQCNHIVYM